jgi:hypothetical protein
MARQIFKNRLQPYIQVRNSSILYYAIPTETYPWKRSEFNKPAYSGTTTEGAVRRIRRAVDMLCQLSPERSIYNPISKKKIKHSLSFVTLTIPGKERRVEAKEGNSKLMAPWLLKMKRKQGLKTYIWKAEFQKNGQLHYHITTPSWLHYQQVKDHWNNILSENGLLIEWKKEHPASMPNSTDVHKVYKIKDIHRYLSKELCKGTQSKTTNGKIWDCSLNIKGAKFFSTPEPSDIQKYISTAEIKSFDRFGMFFHPEPAARLPPKTRAEYTQWLAQKLEQSLF